MAIPAFWGFAYRSRGIPDPGSGFDLLTPDAKWTIVGNSPVSKTFSSRREFLGAVSNPDLGGEVETTLLIGAHKRLWEYWRWTDMPELMPALFFGHGNPMNAVMTNGYTEAWRRTGGQTRKPKAILSISAHWYVPGTGVTISTSPRTIHDFGGFPPELFRVQYPAPGDPQLARRVQQLLAPVPVTLDNNWGLDHGTWSVLVHAYPKADIPVVQLSIDESQPASFHFEIGKRLAPLRDEGILIAGSGNLVHNLHTYAWGRHIPEPYDWAVKFEAEARQMMLAADFKPLVAYESLGPAAMLSIPTPDHYLPLLYVVATQQPGENITFPVEGVDGGSISMLSVCVGSGEAAVR